MPRVASVSGSALCIEWDTSASNLSGRWQGIKRNAAVQGKSSKALGRSRWTSWQRCWRTILLVFFIVVVHNGLLNMQSLQMKRQIVVRHVSLGRITHWLKVGRKTHTHRDWSLQAASIKRIDRNKRLLLRHYSNRRRTLWTRIRNTACNANTAASRVTWWRKVGLFAERLNFR